MEHSVEDRNFVLLVLIAERLGISKEEIQRANDMFMTEKDPQGSPGVLNRLMFNREIKP